MSDEFRLTAIATAVGAVTGVIIAYLLENYRSWRRRRRDQYEGVLRALSSLAQMHNNADNGKTQFIDEQFTRIRNSTNRNPLAIEFQPIVGDFSHPQRFDVGSLTFMLTSHDPDLLNRMLVLESKYLALASLQPLHTAAHSEFQTVWDALERASPPDHSDEQKLAQVSKALIGRVETLVQGLSRDYPVVVRETMDMHHELREFASFYFPTAKLIRLARKDEEPSVPQLQRRPALWRRVLRWCARFLRGTRDVPFSTKNQKAAP